MVNATSHRASVAPAKGINNYQIANAFTAILTSIGRGNLGELLFNWNESEYNADSGKITLHPGRDRGFSRGAEGGKVVVSKKEFLAWLMSEAPFDPVVYGSKISEISSWTTLITASRDAYRRVVPTPPAAELAVKDSAAFKNWFARSVAVTADLQPQVVYHGTRADFTNFDCSKESTGQTFSAQVPGFWFSEDRKIATSFGPRVIACYLALKNPYRISAEKYLQWFLYSGKDPAKYRKTLERAGYDGLIVDVHPEYANGRGPSGTEEWGKTNFVAFHPSQIINAEHDAQQNIQIGQTVVQTSNAMEHSTDDAAKEIAAGTDAPC